MLDHLDTDLARMSDLNELIREGRQAFGDDFLEKLNEVGRAARGTPFRQVQQLVVRPSADLGVLAAQVLENLPEAVSRSPLFRLAMRNLTPGRRSPEADLLSYLLFDGEFLDPLAELGFRDARAMEDELVEFFTD
jgi:NTE family protein